MKIVLKRALRISAFLLALPFAGFAQERSIPFWPDEVPEAIHSAVDGRAALETVRELSRFHRVHGSPGLASAAEHVRKKLLAVGLSDAAIERFPADGKTRYAHFRSYYGWNPVSATLEEVSPTPRLIESFPDLPVALADYSQDADVTAELVDVGAGSSPKDYEGRDVRGGIVLADGGLPTVHRLACEERGAAGFLSDFPNQTTAWSGDDRDLVRWGHLSPYQTANRFAFMLSKRQAADLRARLAAGEKIRLRARVSAKMVPATFDVVVATIPGTDPSAGEVVLTAHLCHESAGANDNASGSAAILEVARSLASAIRERKLSPPRRTIRFLWLPEIAGSQAYLIRHPEVAKRLVGGIHMDMVGGLLSTTKGTFHLSLTAASLPHVVNHIARAWFEPLVRASARYAEGGGDPYAGFVWPPGSREVFLGDIRPLEMGSDHEVFEEASFRVPLVYFHDWPDVTIHTNKDQPENLDPTKLGRVAYLGAGIAWTLAALPDSEAPQLLRLTAAQGLGRVAAAKARASTSPDAPLFEREAVEQGIETLRSLAALFPSTAATVREEERRLAAMRPAPGAARASDIRVPVRSPEVRGPLDVYYYDHIGETIGPMTSPPPLARRDHGDVLAYEALNLVDGRRTVSEIRDILTGRYSAVAIRDVSEYFDLLARAKVISWK
jgi:aminopeptidase YwaD